MRLGFISKQGLLILFFLVLTGSILLEQFLVWGIWFSPEQLHHETFALMALSVAFTLLLVWIIAPKPKHRLSR